MGIGSARGDDRAVGAAQAAIASPLLEASIDGAHGVLLSIAGGSDLGLFEINESARLVAEAAHPDANIIFGAVIDDTLGDEVRVTVIAAGFDGGHPPTKREAAAGRRVVDEAAAAAEPAVRAEAPVFATVGAQAGVVLPPGLANAEKPGVDLRQPRTISFDEPDDLDVPDFLK